MKVGLYFGSFNPIHNGHLIIANFILQNTGLEQVWFIVSPQNPLKPAISLLNEYHRLFLVQIAIEGEAGLKASDIEFRLPKPSYTIDTLTYLSEKYSTYQFGVIMGSDSYQNLSNWKNFKQILRHYPIYVYSRPGNETAKNYADAQVTNLKAPLIEISATHIRNILQKGHSIRYLVPDKVKEEIERNGYYRH